MLEVKFLVFFSNIFLEALRALARARHVSSSWMTNLFVIDDVAIAYLLIVLTYIMNLFWGKASFCEPHRKKPMT